MKELKNKLMEAEEFIKEAKELGLEPSVFNLLEFLDIEYKWNKSEKKIEVSEKNKKLLEFLKLLLQKHFPKKGGSSEEDSPM